MNLRLRLVSADKRGVKNKVKNKIKYESLVNLFEQTKHRAPIFNPKPILISLGSIHNWINTVTVKPCFLICINSKTREVQRKRGNE